MEKGNVLECQIMFFLLYQISAGRGVWVGLRSEKEEKVQQFFVNKTSPFSAFVNLCFSSLSG